MCSLSNAVELLNVLQDTGQSLSHFPLRLECGDMPPNVASLLVSMYIVLAEAVVSSVAPLVMRFVDVATREMRENGSPAMKTQSLP
jgi:hypothetical protein